MPNNHKPLSVLAIDDEPIILALITEFLQADGQRVVQAISGDEGLRKFKSNTFDLVLTDLQMPQINGFEVLQEIKRLEPDTPVIIISGLEEIDDSIEAFRLGAWDFLKKPINFSLLINSISKAREHIKLLAENRQYQDSLEEQILARTAELQHRTVELKNTNARLKNEIKIRIKAEKKQQKLEAEFQRAKNLDSLGLLAGGIAHDFNNLLSAILGYIDYAKLEAPDQPTLNETLNNAKIVTKMAATLTKQFITFSKGGSPRLQTIDLALLLNESLNFVKHDMRGINFNLQLPQTTCFIKGDVEQLGIVLRNIFFNAMESMPNGGEISIQTDSQEFKAGNYLNLESGDYWHVIIRDQGNGISEESINRIFDPYFTTKSLGREKGQGLGLSVSYSIIKKHSGNITIKSTPGHGTNVSIFLPLFTGEIEN